MALVATAFLPKDTTYEMITVDKLKTEDYQRGLNTGFAKSIAAEWDVNKAGVIVASYRDGVYRVIDGQHRVYAARIKGVLVLMCMVRHGLSHEQESELFIALNKRRKGLLAYDYYNASLIAKQGEALNINAIATKNGFTVSRGSADKCIQAIGSLNTIYKKYGDNHLDKTLHIVGLIWGGEVKSLNKTILIGMAEFIKIYGDDIKEDLLVKQLGKVAPVKIVREAEADSNNVSKSTKIMNVLFKYYNAKLRNRLTNKHSAY